MRKLKILSLMFLSFFILCSCKKVDKKMDINEVLNKTFTSFDNGEIKFSLNNGVDPMITLKLPNFCWNKDSGLIVDTNGKVFKKLNKDDAKLEAFKPKIEIKKGKKYINCDSKFFPNDRFELKDKYTITDTLLNIEYTDKKGKYNLQIDENEYPAQYKEVKEILKNSKDTLNALKEHKNAFSKEVKDAIEKEIELEDTKN